MARSEGGLDRGQVMESRRGASGSLVLVLGAALLLGGCGSDAACAAPVVKVTPAQVVAGGTVTVVGEGFLASCYDQGEGASPVSKGLLLTLTPDAAGADGIPLGAFDAADDASVRATATVPAATPPGPATLILGRASAEVEVVAG